MPQGENRPEVKGDGDSSRQCASVSLCGNLKTANHAISPASDYQRQPQFNAMPVQQQQQHPAVSVVDGSGGSATVNLPKASKRNPPHVVKPTKGFWFQENLRRLGINTTAPNGNVLAITLVTLLVIVFLASFIGFVVMWFTNTYNNVLFETLILSNGSTALKWWKVPPVDPYLRVHIFNYTNTERWKLGLDKNLHVEDLGPYVYKEKFEKVAVHFNDNFTISYKEKRTYEFLPEESKGRQSDKIVFPNVVLFTVIHAIKDMSDFTKPAFSFSLTFQNAFNEATAHELIWGYNDGLFDTIKKIKNLKTDKFGLLVARKGVSDDTMTIFTGEDDINKLSVIHRLNDDENLNFWATDECNRIDGTDGSQFPPYVMDKKHPLNIFSKAFCRKFPLYYDSEVNILGGIPAWRYKAPLDVFATPDTNPSNQCFCDQKTGVCPPSGVFDVSQCFDAPILLSFPHFLTGENSLFNNIDGMNPVEELHRSYADVHPRLAFPIGGASRVQINVQINTNVISISALRPFKDKQVLPVIWMEIVSGNISDELRSLIYHSTFGVNAIQLALNYGTLIASATSLSLLILICLYKRTKKAPTNTEQGSASFTSSAPPVEDIPKSVECETGVKSDLKNPYQFPLQKMDEMKLGGDY